MVGPAMVNQGVVGSGMGCSPKRRYAQRGVRERKRFGQPREGGGEERAMVTSAEDV